MSNRIVLAGTSSNVGKTSITIGIMAALIKRGYDVQPFKVGPDYIDPAFHTYITGRKSRNLDFFMMGEEGIKYSFVKNSRNADISVIEGVMGMYDGASTQKNAGSTAHVSKLIDAPVILVIDGSGISASAAAMVKGYQTYDPLVKLAGVIVNKVSGDHHYQLIKTAIERELGIPCLGYFKKNDQIQLGSRHLGLVPAGELQELNDKVEELTEMALETIELDQIIKLSEVPLNFTANTESELKSIDVQVRIGIAKDQAFNFYYQDNLDILESLGAELVEFSPVSDEKLPEDLHGIIFGGGFPEVFADRIKDNKVMMTQLKELINNGIPTYAECGGFMFLNQKIINFEKEAFEMLGVFEGYSEMTKRLQRFGYVDVELNKDVIVGQKGWNFKGHEFHRSIVSGIDEERYAYTVRKIRDGKLLKEWKCGASTNNVLGAYAHIHFYSCPDMPVYFVQQCKKYKGEK